MLEHLLGELRVGIAATRASVVEPGVHLSDGDVAVHGQTVLLGFGGSFLHRVEGVQAIDRFVTDALARLEKGEVRGEYL